MMDTIFTFQNNSYHSVLSWLPAQILCYCIIMLTMDEDLRHRLIHSFIKQPIFCLRHPEQIANMVMIQESSFKGLICSNCYSDLLESQPKDQINVKPLKYLLMQVNNSCNSLTKSLNTCAFVDHHFNLIRELSRRHCRSFESLLQISIANYFQKSRDMLRGKYFQEFYDALELIDILRKSSQRKNSEEAKIINKLVDFMIKYHKQNLEFQQYSNLTTEDKMSGVAMLKQIQTSISEVYKQLKEKLVDYKRISFEEEILQLFNPNIDYSRSFKFSTTLHHHQLKINDVKKMKMLQLEENEYTLIALIEPSIGRSKRTIKFKMDGIKGWVSVGIAIRQTVESNSYKFQSGTAHGTFQVSYDGYSWTNELSTNEQYTSWYYNQNDTVTLTVDPSTSELTYIRNQQTGSPNVLKYTCDKTDKLYFCVSLNYKDDAVSIID